MVHLQDQPTAAVMSIVYYPFLDWSFQSKKKGLFYTRFQIQYDSLSWEVPQTDISVTFERSSKDSAQGVGRNMKDSQTIALRTPIFTWIALTCDKEYVNIV